jgi:hypothetical protein
MKFKLLSIGQKFKFQNEVYVKTSPLIASNVETGHNKMIPRYATLILLDNTSEKQPKITDKPVDAKDVLTTFNIFYEKCISTLENNNVLVPIIKDEMDKARDEFIQQLTQ